jgi:hypothetical protein
MSTAPLPDPKEAKDPQAMSRPEPSPFDDLPFFTPSFAAARLGISTRTLVDLLKAGGYAFTDLSPSMDRRSWGRGRKAWGLTRSQLDAIIDGQARRFPKPSAPGIAPKSAFLPGHDGISRIRKVTPRRKKAGPDNASGEFA